MTTLCTIHEAASQQQHATSEPACHCLTADEQATTVCIHIRPETSCSLYTDAATAIWNAPRNTRRIHVSSEIFDKPDLGDIRAILDAVKDLPIIEELTLSCWAMPAGGSLAVRQLVNAKPSLRLVNLRNNLFTRVDLDYAHSLRSPNSNAAPRIAWGWCL